MSRWRRCEGHGESREVMLHMAKTIMVVDDEKDMRETLSGVLKKAGFSVITAVSGNDCLEKLKKAKPDLILLDIMMPGLSSRSLVEKVGKVKVVYVSVVRLAEAEKGELLKKKNIVAFIEKPFDVDELVETVKKHLS